MVAEFEVEADQIDCKQQVEDWLHTVLGTEVDHILAVGMVVRKVAQGFVHNPVGGWAAHMHLLEVEGREAELEERQQAEGLAAEQLAAQLAGTLVVGRLVAE